MTKEVFEKAKEIEKEIDISNKKVKQYNERAKRFDDYIEWMDGRHKPIQFAGKTYKKVEIKFNMDEKPTAIHVEDLFDLVEENKKEFLSFLKKCQANYLKMVKDEENKIQTMENMFSELGNEIEESKTA